ncbi:MAG TPA: heparan-alpha-glucosaminide N-acetyltransferase domain-containing protein [Telluria sp.]|nr:heparan-alpha-glucosaminide N-acetyltransferase domain-containing protein [Telluria sp.]
MGKTARIPAIDILRGLVIALMALDHVRDFFGVTLFAPEDLSATTPAWFWTRWITHLCATTFVLLAGSSAYLRGASTGLPALSRYLFTRGLMLIVLEATWITFSWQLGYNFVILQVLWAIGMGMVALAGLVWLPRPVIALVAALLIVPHNLLDSFRSASPLWMAWHQGGFVPLGDVVQGVAFKYPLMPWIGLMAAGYAIGPVFQRDAASRQRFLWIAAAALMVAFVALRASNLYGDPHLFTPTGRGAMFDLMAFVNVEKYPPSLLYLMVTGSIGLALLAMFDRMKPVRFLQLIGRVPMFFYVIHIALFHMLGNLYFNLRFGSTPNFDGNSFVLPPGYEPSLAVVYAAWILLMVVMYGLCSYWSRREDRRMVARAVA